MNGKAKQQLTNISSPIRPNFEAQECSLQTVIVVRIFVLRKMCKLGFYQCMRLRNKSLKLTILSPERVFF